MSRRSLNVQVWSGDRVHEYEKKLAGATYMEIHQMGGGIHFTVNHTRKSSEEELVTLLKPRLDRMLRLGTTAIEAKSGYGLEKETEMKMLKVSLLCNCKAFSYSKVLHQVGKTHPITISATYLGAHAIPKGMTEDQATEDIIQHQLPELDRLRREGLISVDNIDVFCEKGVYDTEHTQAILKVNE
jgi:imidazolonepropionase